ncbi:MAG TPA: hypothetical protein VE959_20745 [Bryobacteraceae bacterium]|nr:hypothetical protein [Bryobacteraceae bacterium]
MSRWTRLVSIGVTAALSMTIGSGQRETIAEIFDNNSVDVSKIARGYYTVEMANQFVHVRVMRARLAANARVPTHHHNAGLIVALTAVDLRLTRPDGQFRDLHIPAGETRWIDGEIHSERNLGGPSATAPCEFLFIETEYTGGL